MASTPVQNGSTGSKSIREPEVPGSLISITRRDPLSSRALRIGSTPAPPR
jgi:hypothetical protein